MDMYVTAINNYCISIAVILLILQVISREGCRCGIEEWFKVGLPVWAIIKESENSK